MPRLKETYLLATMAQAIRMALHYGEKNLNITDIFGEDGRHARTALAMAQLPLGASVEVEIIFQLKS